MKKLKAELYDKTEYMMKENFFDGTVHAYLKYSGNIDKDVFTKVLDFMIEKAPILHSSFQYNYFKPYWKVEEYDIKDILSFEHSNSPEEDVQQFLLDTIQNDSKVQIFVKVFYNDKYSIIGIRINHLCVDGSDLKYFLRTMCYNYNNLINGNRELIIKTGSRSAETIYNDYSFFDKIKARNLICYTKYKNNVYFPWSKSLDNINNIIIKQNISKNDYSKLIKELKKAGSTVNDALLASTIVALYETLNNNNECISIASAVDLRRHLKKPNAVTGLTNHASLMGCTIKKYDNINIILKEVTNITTKQKNDKFLGLYGIPLIRLAFSFLPFNIALRVVSKGYVDPKLLISDLGKLDSKDYSLHNLELEDLFITGTVKHKPYFLLTASTFNNILTLSTAINGNDEDAKIAKDFINKVIENLKKIKTQD